ncbi:MAG TPA: hypothetical protein VGE59_04640 [Patescibacteria group bacterium]
MNYTGVIIEESLRDSSLLKDFKITGTEIEIVNENFKTPWLTQWTLHTIEIEEDDIDRVADQISRSFDRDHSDWYADFKNDVSHYIIFPNKVFKVDCGNVENYRPAVKHGFDLGIPIYQLNFKPEIEKWQF